MIPTSSAQYRGYTAPIHTVDQREVIYLHAGGSERFDFSGLFEGELRAARATFVLLWRYCLQVVGVDTGGLTTKMVRFQSIRYRAFSTLVRFAMSETFRSEHPVACGIPSSYPDPALRRVAAVLNAPKVGRPDGARLDSRPMTLDESLRLALRPPEAFVVLRRNRRSLAAAAHAKATRIQGHIGSLRELVYGAWGRNPAPLHSTWEVA